MRLEGSLFELVKNEFAQPDTLKNEPADFFTSALKTARLSTHETRAKIMADIAEALACDVDALMFLFDDDMPQNDNDAQIILPNFRQTILLEAAE